jgi:hypothetical protein
LIGVELGNTLIPNEIDQVQFLLHFGDRVVMDLAPSGAALAARATFFTALTDYHGADEFTEIILIFLTLRYCLRNGSAPVFPTFLISGLRRVLGVNIFDERILLMEVVVASQSYS